MSRRAKSPFNGTNRTMEDESMLRHFVYFLSDLGLISFDAMHEAMMELYK